MMTAAVARGWHRGALIRKGLTLAAQAALITLPVSAQEPWEGVWAADPVWCAYADQIGTHDPAPVLLTATELRGLETECRVVDVRPDYEFSFYVVTSECAGEGSSWANVDVLMMGDAGVLWRWMGGGEPVRLTRCEQG
jgi:hypothetical protein